jgi:adenylate cyclase
VHKVIRRVLYAAAVAAVITAVCAAGLSGGVLDGFQRRASDSLFPAAPTDDRVVVVAIDAKTIDYLKGIISPPRDVHATIARQLTAAGAAVVVWDVVFSGAREPAQDQAFAEALGTMQAPVLGASYESTHPSTDDDILDVELAQGPQPEFAAAGNTTVAHVNVTNDPSDGVIRSLPLVYDDGRTFIPSLSLEALRAYLGQTGPITRIAPDGIQVGNRFIPTERKHSLRVNFAPGLEDVDEDKAIISAADVITGNLNPERLRDKIVFIGATEPISGDVKLVPVDKTNTYPGVLIHANALNTMLTRSYLEPVSDAENTVVAGLLALLVALSVLFLPVWASVVLVFLLIGLPPLFPGAFLLVVFERFDNGDIMNIVYALGAIVAAFVGGLAVRYLTETRQRRRVSSLFAQYVPEAVAKQLEESGSLEEHVEGERVDVGLFFCDLRGFTSLSATLEPQDVRAMLNKFYDLLTEIIHSHHGTVLKFVGDEVFAVFGAPLPCENNAQSTLDCAIEIQSRATELDAELANLHIPPVKFGIGMNAGPVVAAHIGGGRRRQYDIVGDTVNLGSRLCSQAGKGEIVLPESMIERLTDVPEMESMGAVQLKGLEDPVPLFKVVVGESEPRQPTPPPAPVPESV